MTLPYLHPETLLPSEGLVGREGKAYFPHPDLLAAANAALVIQRPLLLTGDAGCGKTDFAFAAASGLPTAEADPVQAKVLECYVRSDSSARDLLYHYDALRRFGDAQHGGEEGRQQARDPRPYLQLEALGRALVSPLRRVVLIDEIDKAPRDLPNDLLRELDEGAFEIPEIATESDDPSLPIDPDNATTFRRTMKSPNPEVKPLVIITSNVERQLPDPFLRRCVFFHIPFPDGDDLQRILRSRFDDEPFLNGVIDVADVDPVFKRIVDVFEAIRSVPALTKKPTTAELIHWTQALGELYGVSAVLRALDELVGGSDRDAKGRHGEIRWRDLPAMGCLIKLREDRERLFEAVPR